MKITRFLLQALGSFLDYLIGLIVYAVVVGWEVSDLGIGTALFVTFCLSLATTYYGSQQR